MQRLATNGIDGATGKYLRERIDIAKVVERISRRNEKSSLLAELRRLHAARTEPHLRLKEGLDCNDLAQAGWGIVFADAEAEDADRKRQAIAPLLELRRRQAGRFYREFSGDHAVKSGESKSQFTARHGIAFAPPDPRYVPYYLLICAGPVSIPYEFQYELDVQYAVGRIHFDSIEEYERYALAVVAAECGELSRAREVVFFGTEHPDDDATALSTEHLVKPLVARLQGKQADWNLGEYSGAQATKASLAELMTHEHGPALVFTASHGVCFPSGHARQLKHQGALLCQDWPGPVAWGNEPISPAHYLSADDVTGESRVSGLMTFHFACYSAGTPEIDDFAFWLSGERKQIAPAPFVASLPNRLLSHPQGGALASVAHVGQALGYSFLWPGAPAQVGVFEAALTRLLRGYPIGAAMDYFNEKYAELATVLSSTLGQIELGKAYDAEEVAGLWTATNDARSYVIVGDPAVRLAVKWGSPQ